MIKLALVAALLLLPAAIGLGGCSESADSGTSEDAVSSSQATLPPSDVPTVAPEAPTSATEPEPGIEIPDDLLGYSRVKVRQFLETLFDQVYSEQFASGEYSEPYLLMVGHEVCRSFAGGIDTAELWASLNLEPAVTGAIEASARALLCPEYL